MKILGLGPLNKISCSTDLKIVQGTLIICMAMKVRFRSVDQKYCSTDLKIVQGT